MGLLAIDDLVTPITEDEVLEEFLEIIETMGLPARSWRKGGARRVILRAVARVYAGFSKEIADWIKGGFLDWAEKSWLTLLAYYVYGVERTPPGYASGVLTFDNSEGGGLWGPFEIGTVRARNPVTRKVYQNAEVFTVNPGEVLTGISFTAVEAGSASSAAPGGISELETTMEGVVVTNPASFAASDGDSDPDLRQKCRNKLGALSMRGPRAAYAYAITTATRLDGSPVDINRYRRVLNDGKGIVTYYVASPSGAPLPDDIDRIKERIEEVARPDTVKVVLEAATPVALTKTITVWAIRQDGVAAADIKKAVEDALVAAVKSYPIGGIDKPPTSSQGYLYGDWVAGIAKGAAPSIYDVDGSDEDLALDLGEVATLATTVDVRIVEAS